MAEARNLRNMTVAQTPLLGEENTPLHADPVGATGFGGATPRHQTAFTPNPLATPQRMGLDGGATPRDGVSATPLRTPMRDNLSINPEGFGGQTPNDGRRSIKNTLRAGFANLPKPENNFELMVPEEEEAVEANEKQLSAEDAADRDARLKHQRELEEQRILARRSQAVKLGLPRPANVDPDELIRRFEPSTDGAESLVNAEVAQLLLHDSIAHPLPGTTRPGSAKSTYVSPDDTDIESARDAIHTELATLVGFPNANTDQIRDGLLALVKADSSDHEASSWHTVRKGLVLNTSSGEWVDPATLTDEQRVEGYSGQLTEIRELMIKEASKVQKAEKKLSVQLGGYQARFNALSKRLIDSFSELQAVQIDYESFSRLKISEEAAGPRRVAALQEEVEFLASRENKLQGRYQELDQDRRESEARVAALEERLMAEAEALNDAALAEMET